MPNLNQWLYFLILVSLLIILPNCTDKTSKELVAEGWDEIDHDNFKAAEHSFQQALNKKPKNAEAYYGLGTVYNVIKRFEDAEIALKKAVRLDPTYVDAHYSLGYLYEQMGKEQEARKHYSMYNRLKKKKEQLQKEVKEKL